MDRHSSPPEICFRCVGWMVKSSWYCLSAMYGILKANEYNGPKMMSAVIRKRWTKYPETGDNFGIKDGLAIILNKVKWN